MNNIFSRKCQDPYGVDPDGWWKETQTGEGGAQCGFFQQLFVYKRRDITKSSYLNSLFFR